MNTTYETTERDFLFSAIAGRDRFIAQLELENHTLRTLLAQRDQLVHDMRDIMSVSSSAPTEYTASSTPIPTPVASPGYNSAEGGFTITATEEPITIVTVLPAVVEEDHTLSAEASVVEDASVKQSRRKVSDYLEPGDTIKHAIRGKGEWRLTYTGSVFVHEVTGDSYKSLQAIAKAHREGKGHWDGWYECMVERTINGVSTWIRINKLEKQTA